jgi:YD repeat-containing protein
VNVKLLALLAAAGSAFLLNGRAEACETVTYGYDPLGRLVSTSSDVGPTTTLAYDPAGNRLQYGGTTTGGAAGGCTSSSPQVANGSFENPAVGSGYVYRPTPAGSIFLNNAGVTGNSSAFGFAPAPDGTQVGFLQSGHASPATISLSVTGLTVGGNYRFRFRIAIRPGYGAINVGAAFNGTSLGGFFPASTAFTEVTSASFTAAATSGTVTFTGEVLSVDKATGIDVVIVERVL